MQLVVSLLYYLDVHVAFSQLGKNTYRSYRYVHGLCFLTKRLVIEATYRNPIINTV